MVTSCSPRQFATFVNPPWGSRVIYGVADISAVLAASQGGTPVWVTPLIAAGAAIIAAAVTALAGAYVARRKVAELQLSNSFELAKQYLESARNYTQSVYLPLAVEIYKLHDGFLSYKVADQDQPESAGNRFENDCELFIDAVNSLFIQGAGAVFTVRLDEDVTSFVSFLRESLTAERVVNTRSLLTTAVRAGLTAAALIAPGIGPAMGVVAGISTSQLLEFGAGSAAKHEIAAAPIASKKFEEQFTLYVSEIKSGIKQVTLGGYKE